MRGEYYKASGQNMQSTSDGGHRQEKEEAASGIGWTLKAVFDLSPS